MLGPITIAFGGNRIRTILGITSISIAAILSGCIGVAAVTGPMIMPEGRVNRSVFDMYRSEEGAPMFRYRVLHFSAQSKDRQQDNAQQWLQEWFKANSYCKSGYDILSNSYEPFPRAVFGLDPFTIGGSVVAIGKCKPLVTSAAAP